jgi:hypothetical protein
MSMVDTGHTDVETLVSTKLFRWGVHPATYLQVTSALLPGVSSNEQPEAKHKKLGDKKKLKKVEEQGIDPCASCMLSTRSTI